MSHADRMSNALGGEFHPVSYYDSPDAVLRDPGMSAAEKRVILSSWASDMYAVDSNPALREVPGIARPMHLADILAALRSLDDDNDPPPRGAAAMRPIRLSKLNAIAGDAEGLRRRQPMRIAVARAGRERFGREANVRRYRRLLATYLTEKERQFVERRLAEELQAAQ